jgi:hypothetical protein
MDGRSHKYTWLVTTNDAMLCPFYICYCGCNFIYFTDLATFEGAESRVSTLVAAANSHDNLCRMDPAWHPWL